MSLNLSSSSEGRVAVVTCASRGIGRAIAQRLAAAGATAAVAARSLERSSEGVAGTFQETAELFGKSGGKAIQIACDIENIEKQGASWVVNLGSSLAGTPVRDRPTTIIPHAVARPSIRPSRVRCIA